MYTPKQSRYTLKGNRLVSPIQYISDDSSDEETMEDEALIIIEPPIRAEEDLTPKSPQSNQHKDSYADLDLPLTKLQHIYRNLYQEYIREKERYIQLEHRRQKMTKSIKHIRARISQLQDETESTNDLIKPTFRQSRR